MPIVYQRVLCSAVVLALIFWAEAAPAQVSDVTVGITPTCPYGLEACWAGAYEALMRIEGVESVSTAPNLYNCTASIRLKGHCIPDPDQWAAQFKKSVDQTYVFRGVEVTVQGTLEVDDGSLMLRVPGVEQPIKLGPLEHKLQWNSRKHSARQPEPDERDAYQQLTAAKSEPKAEEFSVKVTGPLINTDQGLLLEVREFFSAAPEASSRQPD